MRARLGRTIAIIFAITASVSFVVGSFVLADSLTATFDDLFAELSTNVDLEVRSAQEFDTDEAREPIDIGDRRRDPRDRQGSASVEPTVTRYAQLLDADGDAVSAQGAPTFGVSWEGDAGVAGVVDQGGAAPIGHRPAGDRQGDRRPCRTSWSATRSPT